MKYFCLFLCQLLLFTSCKKEGVQPPHNEVKPKPTINWQQFEKEVYQTMIDLERSNDTNRKKYIEQFLNYQHKVDGGIAEEYSNFAFEYMEDRGVGFFSVLQNKDSLLLKNWAAASAHEIAIIAATKRESDSLWGTINENHFDMQFKLQTTQKELNLYYLIKLREATKKLNK